MKKKMPPLPAGECGLPGLYADAVFRPQTRRAHAQQRVVEEAALLQRLVQKHKHLKKEFAAVAAKAAGEAFAARLLDGSDWAERAEVLCKNSCQRNALFRAATNGWPVELWCLNTRRVCAAAKAEIFFRLCEKCAAEGDTDADPFHNDTTTSAWLRACFAKAATHQNKDGEFRDLDAVLNNNPDFQALASSLRAKLAELQRRPFSRSRSLVEAAFTAEGQRAVADLAEKVEGLWLSRQVSDWKNKGVFSDTASAATGGQRVRRLSAFNGGLDAKTPLPLASFADLAAGDGGFDRRALRGAALSRAGAEIASESGWGRELRARTQTRSL